MITNLTNVLAAAGTLSVVFAYLRYKRNIGRLEIESIEEKPYSVGEGLQDDGYGGTKLSNHRFSADIEGHNDRIEEIAIKDILFDPDGVDETVQLSPHTGFPVTVDGPGDLGKYVSGELNHEIPIDGKMEGELSFVTSEKDVVERVCFPPPESSGS